MSDEESPDANGLSTQRPHTTIDDGTVQELQAFISRVVADAGADGVVVNLSGGLDSTVAATLATEALGSDSVDGLILPAEANDERNVVDARHVAEELAIDHREIDIQPVLSHVYRTVTSHVRERKSHPLDSPSRVVAPVKHREGLDEAIGNAAARLRMLIAYFEANTTSKLVLGTGNRTELLLGYFTKYGDGGVDLLPIGDLYKTEVRALARRLDVREQIIEKPPTAGLWEGQSDEAELGAPYETIDQILTALVDLDRDVEAVAEELAVAPELVRTYARMYRQSEHKRTAAPTPATYEADGDEI